MLSKQFLYVYTLTFLVYEKGSVNSLCTLTLPEALEEAVVDVAAVLELKEGVVWVRC
jgi:hypothetical protein